MGIIYVRRIQDYDLKSDRSSVYRKEIQFDTMFNVQCLNDCETKH